MNNDVWFGIWLGGNVALALNAAIEGDWLFALLNGSVAAYIGWQRVQTLKELGK